MTDLLVRVKKTIDTHGLIKPGDKVIAAVSGGVDSMTLLNLLCRLRETHSFDVVVAHVNHGLRGKSAERDANFVKDKAKELGLPFYLKKLDISHLQTMLKGSPQEIAREERLRYLEQLAEKLGAHKIALGHNWDDQAETVLMRLIRGAGPAGLRGMDYARDKFIRPILDTPRSEIDEYAVAQNIKNVEDESNVNESYLRNKVRRKLLPLMEQEYNPEIKAGLIRLADILREEDAFLDKLCTDLFAKHAKVQAGEVIFEIPELIKLEPSLRNRLLRMALRHVKHDLRRISHHHIDIIEELIRSKAPQKQLDLPDDIKVVRVYSILVLTSGESAYLASRGRPFEYRMNVPGATWIKELSVTVHADVFPRKGHVRSFVFKPNVAFFDFDKLKRPITIRSFQQGDVFHPYGMDGSKKVKDYFIEQKIPSTQRDMIPLMVSESEVSWIMGYRVSDLFKIDRWSTKILKVSIE